MNLKKLLATSLCSAMLLASSTLFAQVKVGTNPTTIEPASNLEVEASTTGRKIKVDKTTGKMTIKDGSEGAGRILTSDANGEATWMPSVRNSTTIKAIGSGTATALNDLNTTIMNGSSISFTLPSDKSVFINFMAGYDDVTPNGGYFPFYMFTVYIDGQPTDILINIQEPGGSSSNISFTLCGVLDLTAGAHTLDVRGRRSFNGSMPSGTNVTFGPLSQRTFLTYLN